ncbi:MAG: hypothetical protein ABGZ17_07390, partial [Planctomycetaceae bacterium]
FNATRTVVADATRFQWLYNSNPDGRAVIWSLRRSDTNEMVGFTACLPRTMIVNGTAKRAWIGSDFSILPKYRTLGLAVRLRRAAKEAIEAGEVDMLYAHPNDRMAVIHKRAGHIPVGVMQRYARPLRTGPMLQERIGNRLLSSAAEIALDPLLKLADPEKRTRRRYRVEQHSADSFDTCFDQLFEEHCPANTVIGCRGSRYLNWRYGENPLYESHVLTAYENDGLAGYLVWTVEDDSIVVKDLFPATSSVARDLLARVTRLGRERKVRSATLTVSVHHPLEKVLTEFGYKPRAEQSQMYAFFSPHLDQADHVIEPARWHITVGDRDV